MSADDLAPLVAAAREGDGVAVEALVRATQRDVWRLCVALGSQGEVEDLVQESYLRALGALAGFRGEAPFRIWLLGIARRTCSDHVRRRQRQRRLTERVRDLATRDAAPGEGHTAALLAGLADDRREAFVLTQVVRLSYEEAAWVLECPIGTVRSRVARARRDLLEAHRAAEARGA